MKLKELLDSQFSLKGLIRVVEKCGFLTDPPRVLYTGLGPLTRTLNGRNSSHTELLVSLAIRRLDLLEACPFAQLLLRQAPRALEGSPSERQHLLGVGREDFEWRRRTTKGVLLEDIDIWASLQPMFLCLRLLLAQRARRVGCRT